MFWLQKQGGCASRWRRRRIDKKSHLFEGAGQRHKNRVETPVGYAELPELSQWAPLRSRLGFASSDIGEVRKYLNAEIFPHNLHFHDCDDLDFRHYSVKLSDIMVNCTDYGSPKGRVKVVAPNASGFFVINLSVAGNAKLTVGRETVQLHPGSLAIIDADTRFTLLRDSGYMPLNIWIPRKLLEAVLCNELGYALPEPLKFDGNPLVPPSQATPLIRMVQLICSELDASDSIFTLGRVSSYVENMFACALLSAMPHNYSGGLNNTTSSVVPYYVKRVLKFVAANACMPINLDQLVEVSGVSPRSIHAGFRKYLNTTPMSYVKAVRLDNARYELLNAERNGLSVTEIAFSCGFTQPGKFAADYRRRFGVTPSQTRSGRDKSCTLQSPDASVTVRANSNGA